VGLESTTPASERAKTIHALNRAFSVTGTDHLLDRQNPKEFRQYKPEEEILEDQGNVGHGYGICHRRNT
jgi:hypothetical protein